MLFSAFYYLVAILLKTTSLSLSFRYLFWFFSFKCKLSKLFLLPTPYIILIKYLLTISRTLLKLPTFWFIYEIFILRIKIKCKLFATLKWWYIGNTYRIKSRFSLEKKNDCTITHYSTSFVFLYVYYLQYTLLLLLIV